jgi:hypothetical protein
MQGGSPRVYSWEESDGEQTRRGKSGRHE